MSEIVAVDLGGTHARFALVEVEGGRVVSLGEPTTLRTGDHKSFEAAWNAFRAGVGGPLPNVVSIAAAALVEGDEIALTNNDWVLRPARLPDVLGIERCSIVNDFEAVAHAVAQLDPRWFSHLAGPATPLPEQGAVTIVGPGTGLGVAQLVRAQDHYHVVATEGGHIDFAPLDELEDAILGKLRERFGRVSVERVASGSGLANLCEALAALENRPAPTLDDRALWNAALAGSDRLAAAALDRLCLILGAAAGDIALAQGAAAVVIAGGVGLRLADRFPRSGFHERFLAKGRFRGLMEAMPVKLLTHPQAGLYGAAAAFAAE